MPEYAMNGSDSDHCQVCDDTGWVTLLGTVKRHGVEYSRGTTACKWCELGRRRYTQAGEHRQRLESNYTLADVEGQYDDAHGRRATTEERRAAMEQIRKNLGGFGQPLPPPDVPRPEPRAVAARSQSQQPIPAGSDPAEAQTTDHDESPI